MRQTIQATIYSDSGGYVAECPELHAVTQGDTLDETMDNLRDVIALALEDEDLPSRLGAVVLGDELADRATSGEPPDSVSPAPRLDLAPHL